MTDVGTTEAHGAGAGAGRRTRRAEEAYRGAARRQSVADESSRARAVTVGDMLDGSLGIRGDRHPVAGLLAAGTLGLPPGRTTRR